jgi:glycosyltransferase involved in cell wall biosynthesis
MAARPTPFRDEKGIIWLGRVSNDELAALLKDSLCLAFPSYVEGFGLPALEAMALGCPVVASDRASIPEVCGTAALYAAPDDRAAWLGHFLRLQSDAALRLDLTEKGRARAKHFSWRQSAQLYLNLITHLECC